MIEHRRQLRLLHTSDWHLGRSLHGASLLAHQREFLAWLVTAAVEHEVDAVLVAGDVYDRAVPPTDAVALLDEALAGFARAGVAVVLTSGNHDSAIRLGFGRDLAEYAGVHLRTSVHDLDRPVVFGDVGVYGIPYLLPDAVRDELGAERSHESVLRAAATRIRADAERRGLRQTVVLAHAFVTGGAACESERDLSVGGIGDAPAGVFDGLDYVALGHLHGSQEVAPNVRYCGSPLAFSFSERQQRKSVTLVELGETVRCEQLPVPVPRPLAELRGPIDELLADPSGPDPDAWVKAWVTDPVRPTAMMERLRERWPNTVIAEWRPEVDEVETTADLARLRGTTDPVEVCSLFVEWVDSTYPDPGQRDALRDAVDAARAAEISA